MDCCKKNENIHNLIIIICHFINFKSLFFQDSGLCLNNMNYYSLQLIIWYADLPKLPLNLIRVRRAKGQQLDKMGRLRPIVYLFFYCSFHTSIKYVINNSVGHVVFTFTSLPVLEIDLCDTKGLFYTK